MKTLLPRNSPKYLRRLCRELNALPDGFYLITGPNESNERCTRAKFAIGLLWIVPCGNRGFRVIPADSEFVDCYGREVCASRS